MEQHVFRLEIQMQNPALMQTLDAQQRCLHDLFDAFLIKRFLSVPMSFNHLRQTIIAILHDQIQLSLFDPTVEVPHYIRRLLNQRPKRAQCLRLIDRHPIGSGLLDREELLRHARLIEPYLREIALTKHMDQLVVLIKAGQGKHAYLELLPLD